MYIIHTLITNEYVTLLYKISSFHINKKGNEKQNGKET